MTGIGLVGLGRLGQELVKKLAGKFDLVLYDQVFDRAENLGTQYSCKAVREISELFDREIIILAVPDRVVLGSLQKINACHRPCVVVNIATNITQAMVDETAQPHIECVGVKLIGQAKLIALGERPLLVIDDSKPHLHRVLTEIFTEIGEVVSGNSDQVAQINTLAAKMAIGACVSIEKSLMLQGIDNPKVIQSAISQVAAGIMKAYAEDDLGPFARDIVATIKENHK